MLQNKEKVERASYLISNSYFEIIKKELAFWPIIQAEPEKGGRVRVRLNLVAEKILDRDRALFAEAFQLLEDSKQIYDSNEKESLSLLLARSLKVSWLKSTLEKLDWVSTAFLGASLLVVLLTGIIALVATFVVPMLLMSPVLANMVAGMGIILFAGLALIGALIGCPGKILDENLETKSESNRNQLVSKINELKKRTSEEKTTAIPCQDRVPEKVDGNPDFILASEQESKRMAANSHTHEPAFPTQFFKAANSKLEQDETPHASTLSFSLGGNL